MKVELISLTKEAVESRDYREIIVLKVDGVRVFGAADGEPEDATLGRDFSDCWAIPRLMQKAHQAGVNGEPFELVENEVNEI